MLDRPSGGAEYTKSVVAKLPSVLSRPCDNVAGSLFIDSVLGPDVDAFPVCARFFCVVPVTVSIAAPGNAPPGAVSGSTLVATPDAAPEADSVAALAP